MVHSPRFFFLLTCGHIYVCVCVSSFIYDQVYFRVTCKKKKKKKRDEKKNLRLVVNVYSHNKISRKKLCIWHNSYESPRAW